MLCGGLHQHAGFRLPAKAVFRNVVGTKVNSGDRYAALSKACFHPGVNILKVCKADFAKREASLIGHHDNLESGLLEIQRRRENTGEKPELIPAGDVLTLRRLSVDYSIAIKKYRLH